MRTVVIAISAAAALAAVGAAWGQGRLAGRPEASTKPLPGLPAYTAGYRSWTKINRRPLPRRASDPHDGTKNVYASRRPSRSTRRYPYGTVIVKEAFRAGQRAPYLIAVMRKVRGANPRHRDWVMVEWTRSSPSSRFSELARGSICTGCHVGARANDYVFTRR